MDHIFVDTNILQHTAQHPNKKNLMSLHRVNESFYESNKVYLAPQVVDELTDHGFETSQGLGEIVKFELVNSGFERIEYMICLYSDLYDYLMDVIKVYDKLKTLINDGNNLLDSRNEEIVEKPKQMLVEVIKILSDGYFFLSSLESDTLNLYELETGKTLADIDNFLVEQGINYSTEKIEEKMELSLARIIEYTPFGEKTYYGFTHRDINRSIGNLMYDYKRFLLKGDRQKQKIGKDCMLVFDIILYINKCNITLEGNDKIIFISSDYGFIEELNKFLSDIGDGLLETNGDYSDLSTELKDKLMLIKSKMVLIKLDVENLVFENRLTGTKGAAIKYIL